MEDVLIVGAGPAGCTLALYLARAGVSVTMLEAENELPKDLRASTFHPPSLEMMDEIGIIDELLELGLNTPRYQYRDRRTGEVAEFDMSLIADDTRYPYRLQLEQFKMTRIAVKHLADYDCADVLFNHKVVDVQGGENGASVTVETPDGVKEMQARFVIGADGASSIVRKQMGIEYAGFTYEEKFLVVSSNFDFPSVMENLSNVNYVSDPDEWCVILKAPDIWRILFPTEPEDTEEKLLSDAHIQERLHHLHDKDGDYDIGHRSLYNVHQRVAETYVKDNVVLIGDSAHINNPLGGMGMNGGIHDAYNLAVKLKAVFKDGADADAMLAHYDKQRRELAVKFVQDHTIANKKLMEEKDPDEQAKRQAWFMEQSTDPAKARQFLLERSMLNVWNESQAIEA